MAKLLSDVLPQGDTKDELIYKMRCLFLNEYKKNHDAFMCQMCEMIDRETLKKIYIYLNENK